MSNDSPSPEADPTLAVAERQLVLLGELAEIVMVAARVFGSSAVAAAEAEKRILADEYFVPEVGRARACGAKDAAESLQKVARAARLTMKLQMTVAEIVRDIRAGIVTHSNAAFSKDAGETPAVQGELQDRRRPAGSCSPDRDSEWSRSDTNTERLVEFDRPETLPHAPFRETVDAICDDVGATVHWSRWTIEVRSLSPESLKPHQLEHPAATEPEPALPP
jgi:hypothetical protein